MDGGIGTSSDTLAAMEAAIYDGCDVLTMSLGSDSPVPIYDDPVAISALHAVLANVTVVMAAGNDGGNGTVQNTAPWILTVGASTMNRGFRTSIILGNGIQLTGAGITAGAAKLPLITGEQAASTEDTSLAESCDLNSLDFEKFAGKVVACVVTTMMDPRIQASDMFSAGSAGVILYNDKAVGENLIAIASSIPVVNLGYKDGQRLLQYCTTARNLKVSIQSSHQAVTNISVPKVASFSSRGVNSVAPGILKPDVIAPGVNILAAWSQSPYADSSPLGISGGSPFSILSGTSMATPHASGVVALLKSLHPDWSPSWILSAIITTAHKKNNFGSAIQEVSGQSADAFSYGGGQVNANAAASPGLVYATTLDDYRTFLCTRAGGWNISTSLGDMDLSACPRTPYSEVDVNYPSLSFFNVTSDVVTYRRMTLVGPPATYTASVFSPPGTQITVSPTVIQFSSAGEENLYSIYLTPLRDSNLIGGNDQHFTFGSITWSDRKHVVTIPVAANVVSIN
eukprot:TRINITY_DN6170_c0_g1_i1.p1 TRINITY_DN6170_c0_g1~~TRINITY_DN6170_c0_g1_i1.p1  ORF type:complete len:600 (-),score=105.08 TRINITY_DN6170_c0_g1_i1:26-1561(-)